MISINGTLSLASATAVEAQKLHNMKWTPVLIVKLPKSEYTLREAIDLVKEAKAIIDSRESQIFTHYVDGLLTAREDEESCYVWLFRTNTVMEENLCSKVVELEQQITELELDYIEANQQIIAAEQALTEAELALLEGGIADE